MTIEDSNYSNPKQLYEIFCLEGSMACPPEDVGGYWAYDEFRKVLKDPAHVDHEMYMTWSGGKFDVYEVNIDLVKYLRWSRDRLREWGIEL